MNKQQIPVKLSNNLPKELTNIERLLEKALHFSRTNINYLREIKSALHFFNVSYYYLQQRYTNFYKLAGYIFSSIPS